MKLMLHFIFENSFSYLHANEETKIMFGTDNLIGVDKESLSFLLMCY